LRRSHFEIAALTQSTSDLFYRFRARYIAALWLLLAFWLPGFDALSSFLSLGLGWYWYDLLGWYWQSALIALSIALSASVWKIPLRAFFSRTPNASDYRSGILLTAFIFLFSIAAAYALFYPLSLVFPVFVEWWFIYSPDLIYFDRGIYPLVPNFLSLFALCVLAPVLEEVAFRGLLLHRWSARFGVRWAMLLSSALFGIVHSDPIGAFAFGLAMSVLYLRTGSLLLPVICHALNNFVVWLFELGHVVVNGSEDIYTLETFQSEWYIGVATGAVCLVWFAFYVRGRHTRKDVLWQLPSLLNAPLRRD